MTTRMLRIRIRTQILLTRVFVVYKHFKYFGIEKVSLIDENKKSFSSLLYLADLIVHLDVH
jgi:hypothetical protein